MKRTILSVFCAAACAILPASADEIYFEQGFDNSADFAEGSNIPTGWLSVGQYGLYRMKASDLGLPSHSGSYVMGTAVTGNNYANGSVYTSGFELKGGKPCTISFWMIGRGGSPATVRYNQIQVTAGTDQTAEAQTIELGITPGQAHADWTQYTFTFTPETTGTYYFALKVVPKMTSCGSLAIDDVVVEGESPSAVVAGEFNTLGEVLAAGFDTEAEYTFKGEALVSHFDAASHTAYLQDATAGAALVLPAGVSLAAGDKVKDVSCTVAVKDGAATLTLNAQAIAPTESGVALPATPVTIAELAAAPATYFGKLIALDGVRLQNVEAGDVFEEDMEYTLADESGNTAALRVFAEGALLDEEAPTEKLKVTGVATSATAAEIAPRSFDDLEKYKETIQHPTKEMPYQQSFDNENEDYDGSSQLPTGWASTGNVPFVTANVNELLAHGGTYYMITPDSNAPRNERTYTPFFDMEAGKEYIMTFYLYMPGARTASGMNYTNMTVTVGQEQEAAAHTTQLLSIENQSLTKWTLQTVSFTPMVTGQYCFAMNLSSESTQAGYVAVDDVMVREAGGILRPTADFSISTWYDVYENKLMAFDNEPVQLTNLSAEGTEYEWSVPGAVPETSTDKDPKFVFPTDGTYTITLKVKNSKYEKETTKEISVFHPAENQLMGMMNYNPADDKMLSFYDVMPTFATDPNFDYISGPNHYYRRVAQRFTLPADQKLSISNLSTWLVAYSRMSAYTTEDRNHPFTFAFYGETNGRLDESKCFGRKVSTVADEFGTMGIGYEHPKMWGFDFTNNNITVQGNFYIAMEYDDNFPIESPDPNVTRSYVAFGLAKSKAGVSGIHAKPYALPENSKAQVDGRWYNLSSIDPTKSDYIFNLTVWGSFSKGYVPDGIEGAADAKQKLGALVAGSQIQIAGTEAGERVVLFDQTGRIVRTATAESSACSLSTAGLPAGLYIVSGRNGAVKVVLK